MMKRKTDSRDDATTQKRARVAPLPDAQREDASKEGSAGAAAASTSAQSRSEGELSAETRKGLKQDKGKKKAVEMDAEPGSSARSSKGKEQSANTQKNSKRKKGKEKATNTDVEPGSSAQSYKIKKLKPARPFPTVPTSVSATGPRSAHQEGKNYICVTRKTPLGGYLRRCKDVVLKDGYKTLHLSALGAAIPHLLLLATSLPGILPFAPDEIHSEILTGTVEVQDELRPEDDNEDVSYRTRAKSVLSVVIKVGDGDEEVTVSNSKKKNKQSKGGHLEKQKDGAENKGREEVVYDEPEQEDMDES